MKKSKVTSDPDLPEIIRAIRYISHMITWRGKQHTRDD